MLEDEIIEMAKNKRVKIFFDMDGCCAEYGANDGPSIKNNTPNFYIQKRPILSVIKVVKRLSKVKNVEILILSNCHFEEQKQEKIKWLNIWMPFIKKDNINIIKLHDEIYTPETKDFIKASYIEKLTKNLPVEIVFIEDDHRIIKATKQKLPHVRTNHISTLIK